MGELTKEKDNFFHKNFTLKKIYGNIIQKVKLC